MARNAQSIQFTVYYKHIYFCFLWGQEEYWKHNLPFLWVTDTNFPAVCLLLKLFLRWNSVEKIPWGRNILLFFWWERSHHRYWQAQSEFATVSADDLARSHRALGDTIWDHFSLPVHTQENKWSFTAERVVHYSTDVSCTAKRGCNTSIRKCTQSFDRPCSESGQRIVSLHSRLCSEQSSGLVEALVVCGRCLGRRIEGDELKAPQLCRWRSSWPRFLGLPLMRWAITCATTHSQEIKIVTHCHLSVLC